MISSARRESSGARVKRFQLVIAAVLGLLLLAACGGAQQAASGSAAAGGPQDEMTYVVPSLTSGVETFDPSKTVNMFVGPSLGGAIFEQLYTFTPPKGEIKPYLLESGTMAPDAMSWTLKLKDGIKFSNGDPMTSDDVKFSFERFLSSQSTSASGPTLRPAIASIDIVDRLTVRLNLKQPLVDLPNVLVYPGNDGVVLPSKYIQKVGWEAFGAKPIGSGPYVVTGHKSGESVTFEANPNYWRSKPLFKKITLLKVPEEQTRISMLQSGKADMVEITATTKPQVESAGFKSLVVPEASTFMVYFAGAYGDYPDNPVKKQAVRKALTLALDKKALLGALNGGVGEVANFGPSSPDFSPGAPTLPPTPYDPAQAKQLLQQAGYPNGFTLKLWTPAISTCSDDIAKQFGEALDGYWQKIGVTTQVTPVSYAVLRPKLFAQPFAPDVVGSAFTYCLGPAEAARDLASGYYSKTGIHVTNVADTEVLQAINAKSLDAQHQAAQAAYKKIYDAYSGIALFYAGRIYGADKKAAAYPLTRGFPQMMSWWVKDVP